MPPGGVVAQGQTVQPPPPAVPPKSGDSANTGNSTAGGGGNQSGAGSGGSTGSGGATGGGSGGETAGTSPSRSAAGPMAAGDAEHSPLFHVESPHRGATHEQYHLHHRACGRRDRDLVVLRASLSGSRLAAAGGRPLAFPGSRAGPKQPVHLSPVGCGLSATVIHGRLCQYRWHKSAFSCVGGPYDPRCVRPANRQADDHQRPETVRVSVSRSDREPLRLPWVVSTLHRT
jgi:hypothetical protein